MRRVLTTSAVFVLFVIEATPHAFAQDCLPPVRPVVPANANDAREFSNIIKDDFEAYLSEVPRYFACLDAERARAFAEAQQVGIDYGAFLDIVGR